MECVSCHCKYRDTHCECYTRGASACKEKLEYIIPSVWIRNQLDVTFVLFFISPLQVVQHVSGNHVPIFRS